MFRIVLGPVAPGPAGKSRAFAPGRGHLRFSVSIMNRTAPSLTGVNRLGSGGGSSVPWVSRGQLA